MNDTAEGPASEALPSDEEMAVIRLIAGGQKDRAIAKQLGVSVVTVRRRAQHFRARLGAKTRVEAVAIAATRGWLKAGTSPRLSQSDHEENQRGQ